MFSSQEVAYLHTQRLARIATVSAHTQPDVAPVGFEFDGNAFLHRGLGAPEKYWSWEIEQPVSQHGLTILKWTEGTATRRVVLSPPEQRST